MEKDHFIVSLKKYLEANGGKINPYRQMVFNFYECGTAPSGHTYNSVTGYWVKNVRIRRNKTECTGIEQPSAFSKGGKKLTCKLDDIHVDMPLDFLNERTHKGM
jgi:hypothetical protein